jgi:hypothetical protein
MGDTPQKKLLQVNSTLLVHFYTHINLAETKHCLFLIAHSKQAANSLNLKNFEFAQHRQFGQSSNWKIPLQIFHYIERDLKLELSFFPRINSRSSTRASKIGRTRVVDGTPSPLIIWVILNFSEGFL